MNAKTTKSYTNVLNDIAEELDDAIGDYPMNSDISVEEYRLLMAAQSAVSSLRLTITLMETPT